MHLRTRWRFWPTNVGKSDVAFSVWKLGGSLFDLPDLTDRLWNYYRVKANAGAVVIIPGGGALADAVRAFDQTHRLSPQNAHELALGCMQLSAQLITSLLHRGQQPLADPHVQRERLRRWKTSCGPAQLEVWDVISSWREQVIDFETRFGAIPCDWTLTSDSIAAILAAHWQADELVLLKSVDCPPNSTPDEWAAEGLVDPVFPRFARSVHRIRWMNLRTSVSGLTRA